ncbi:metalloregulator ArsR/SmtB family transcription factor [Sandarakinorhabdus sp. AAP62]|uniref:ArsR/SmtB family transcription factor n=1 Tax=Sandarakinorhabdus sp. AAP62 TaxID=1248916 RepID=UPI00030CB691|nr:metalloregulator ArsR/SmtB family transcription factor [Sandarakinorhabdus sp. AAP62]
MIPTDLAKFEQSAGAAARLLKAMAHDSRLLVLCQLVDGEMQAGQFATRLSQSALSQHLAMLRTEGLVATRREGQAIFYRLANPAVKAVITTLAGIYCPPPADILETNHVEKLVTL